MDEIIIKKTNDKAILPKKLGNTLIMYNYKNISIKGGETVIIGTGIYFNIPEDTFMQPVLNTQFCIKGLVLGVCSFIENQLVIIVHNINHYNIIDIKKGDWICMIYFLQTKKVDYTYIEDSKN